MVEILATCGHQDILESMVGHRLHDDWRVTIVTIVVHCEKWPTSKTKMYGRISCYELWTTRVTILHGQINAIHYKLWPTTDTNQIYGRTSFIIRIVGHKHYQSTWSKINTNPCELFAQSDTKPKRNTLFTIPFAPHVHDT